LKITDLLPGASRNKVPLDKHYLPRDFRRVAADKPSSDTTAHKTLWFRKQFVQSFANRRWWFL